MQECFVIKGDICHSLGPNMLEAVENGYVVCEYGRSSGVFRKLPERFKGLPLLDYSGRLVMPGLVDLHVHASQYNYRGTGMDCQLLEWLDAYAFPEELHFSDEEYARQVYSRFTEDMRRGPNTRACVFATSHTESTLLLMELMEQSGLVSMVGRVSMDLSAPDGLRERDANYAISEERRFFELSAGRFEHTEPIITPRFVPSCSPELLWKLGELRKEYDAPVQSHLSENEGEVKLVGTMHPLSKFYGDVYDKFGLFGGDYQRVVMAHCVLSTQKELELMWDRGVYIAHCPASNMNVRSGIAPVRSFLNMGLHCGLGSDVAGGTQLSIFRAMADAIQVSKLRWRLVADQLAPLSAMEAFWMGTAGGGALFNTGSFEKQREFDAIVIDESRYAPVGSPGDIGRRLERCIYLSDDRDVKHKFVRGRQLF